MRLNSPSTCLVCITTTFLSASALATPPVGNGSNPALRIWDHYLGSPQTTHVWDIDISTPDAINKVDMLLPASNKSVSGFEFANGVYYVPDSEGNMNVFDPATGLTINVVPQLFPPEGNKLFALEYADGTMYGALGTNFTPGAATYLVTIDLTTLAITVVGSMGLNSPSGGLAYFGGVMYYVNAGGSNASLYTINLATGAASFISVVRDADSGALPKLTGLEFGNDDILYGLQRGASFDPGDPLNDVLYAIDPVTALAYEVGELAAIHSSNPNWYSLSTSITAITTDPSDLNGDGSTNGADLGLLLANWGNPGSTDLDGDGTTDGADLGLLLAAWSP
ncbi:MAG: hypothetical protein ACYTF7_06430 [Planctomycetota bacterium]|jgi:hypothetical protein